jgi:SAM-dependent methyltransferase
VDPAGIIDMPEESVGFVLSTQVLEHVEDPKAYLKEAHRILEKEGKLILSTHGYWMFHPDPTDFWRWTSTGLKKIVTEAGFEVVYFEGILGRSAMGLQLFQDGLLFKLPKPLRFILSLILQPLIIFFDKIITAKSRNEDACTFVLVAKKV